MSRARTSNAMAAAAAVTATTVPTAAARSPLAGGLGGGDAIDKRPVSAPVACEATMRGTRRLAGDSGTRGTRGRTLALAWRGLRAPACAACMSCTEVAA